MHQSLRVLMVSLLVVGLGSAGLRPARAAEKAPQPTEKAPQPAEKAPQPAEEAPKPAEALVQGNTAFALDLLAKLSEGKGNLFFSPYSISAALAMTYAGARAQTAEQMAKTLHFPGDGAAFHETFGRLIAGLNEAGKSGEFSLVVANALWAQRGYSFEKEFLGLVQSAYGSALNEVDFAKATEAARQAINEWVDKQTNGKIKDLIPPGILTDLTRLVLTNAIYFKGAWQSVFPEKATQDGPFTLLDGEKATVPLMHHTTHAGYLEAEGFQALDLPYKGGALSMVIFLPKRADGLKDFQRELTPEKLGGWLGKLAGSQVVITLPKFKVTSTFSLAETLKALGMADAFDMEKADLSGMNGKKDLYIQAVIHKAFVDVNEKGTEAAAATAVVIGLRSAPMPQKKVIFCADHPFLFLIRDRTSGSILFVGRVVNPKE
jgi:serpin B